MGHRELGFVNIWKENTSVLRESNRSWICESGEQDGLMSGENRNSQQLTSVEYP